jgi:hypothetical protein
MLEVSCVLAVHRGHLTASTWVWKVECRMKDLQLLFRCSQRASHCENLVADRSVSADIGLL